jgi:hypothetical protein
VPAKCLFPDESDSASGVNYRRNLITVDSCDVHNSAKSKDDEYLLYILALNFKSNGLLRIEEGSRIWRAIDRNPSLAIRILKDSRPAVIVNQASGTIEETGAVTIEEDRFYNHLQNMARALYFHTFGARWSEEIFVYPEFLFPDSTANVNTAMESHEKLIAVMNTAFSSVQSIGSNPEVFSYKVVRYAKTGSIFMRLTFYSDCNASIHFRARPRTYGVY